MAPVLSVLGLKVGEGTSGSRLVAFTKDPIIPDLGRRFSGLLEPQACSKHLTTACHPEAASV